MADLSNYSERDQALLRRAAEHHADKIDAAAADPLNDGWVNGFDIRELWPFVVARREELFGSPPPCPSGTRCRKYGGDTECRCASVPEPEPEVAPVEPESTPEPEPEPKPVTKKPPARKPKGRPKKAA